jgi:Rrf2 family protein
MKISTKGRYALRALVDLAEFSEKIKKHVPLKEIAKRQNMSEKYLESLFAIMKSAGIIGSRRGAKGGYYLVKTPRETTALEVINAIEGPVSVVECCTSEQFCDRIDSCKTIRLWKKVNNQVLNELKKTYIQDLMY